MRPCMPLYVQVTEIGGQACQDHLQVRYTYISLVVECEWFLLENLLTAYTTR